MKSAIMKRTMSGMMNATRWRMPGRRTAMRTMLALAGAGLAALVLPVHPAAARTVEQDKTVLAGLLRTHIEPRVGALATAAADEARRLDRFCASPDAAGFEAAREGYHAAMDAWASAQHLRPGPLLLEMRSDRIAFWPERRNIVTRQLGQLLSARDPKVLEPGALAKQSAAVQGLTALEHLLFGEGTGPAAFGGDDAGRYRCALAAAIGRNVAAVAGEVRDGWAALAPRLMAGEATPVGANATEAVNNLFSSAITAMQIVVDQKFMIPLGGTLAEAKPELAESFRSGRSSRNIARNLGGLRSMTLGEEGGPGFATLLPDTADGAAARRTLTKAFDDALAAVAAIPVPLNKAVADAKARPAAEQALRAAKTAQNGFSRTLPPLIGITLGFNELDGD